MRRAWIEIYRQAKRLPKSKWSLSMRRAWIEISDRERKAELSDVALHAESVDRNFGRAKIPRNINCRSPCGERG